MIPVILDCDNTMGLKGKDVDDGLALLYLLGSDNIDLKAITTTFGNSTIEHVHPNTKRILKELKREHIPLYKGAPSSENCCSEAAQALVDMVNQQPQELTILATGSTTNLRGAYELDAHFFNKVKHIVMMGGIEKPLNINGKIMKELNFASDPLSIQTVLTHANKLSIITGHVCLDALFSHDSYHEMAALGDRPIFNFIEKETKHWIDYIGGIYKTDGFYNWDAVAAVFIDHPELFDCQEKSIGSSLEDLQTGFLRSSHENGRCVSLPYRIKNIDDFNNTLMASWGNVFL